MRRERAAQNRGFIPGERWREAKSIRQKTLRNNVKSPATRASFEPSRAEQSGALSSSISRGEYRVGPYVVGVAQGLGMLVASLRARAILTRDFYESLLRACVP